jgi:YD repeat-containing protein
VTQTTFPSTLTETYGYDQLFNLTSKTDRKNQTIQYVYDSLYRMTSKTYPDSTAVDYVHDLVGKIQQVADPTGTYGFAYDNTGRLIGTTTQYTFLLGHNFQNGSVERRRARLMQHAQQVRHGEHPIMTGAIFGGVALTACFR